MAVRELHASRRAAQRLGKSLTRNMRATIFADIRGGRAEFVGEKDGKNGKSHEAGRTLWRLVVWGKSCVVVLSPDAKAIITIWRENRVIG